MNRINYNAGFGGQCAAGWSNKPTCLDAHVGTKVKGWDIEVKGSIDKNGQKDLKFEAGKDF